jgi:hypothetical protein
MAFHQTGEDFDIAAKIEPVDANLSSVFGPSDLLQILLSSGIVIDDGEVEAQNPRVEPALIISSRMGKRRPDFPE